MMELGIFKLLQTFWGLAVVCSLGGYSVYHALEPSEAPASVRRESPPVEGPSRRANLAAWPTPMGGYPTPAPLTIYVACDSRDGETARYDAPAHSGYQVVRLDLERDVVAALLRNEPTRYPPNATVVQTPCIRSLIRSGQLP